MADFITGYDLNAELGGIFEDAEKELIIISPYIKLHEKIKSILKTKIGNSKLKIIVVFGKNQNDVSKSMNINDFEFFKQFPNIQIRYEKRLHAKLYANENEVIITSMNLYDYSQDTNIESGIISKAYDKVGGNTLGYFERVIEQADLIYKKVPQFDTKMFGMSKKYNNSEIEVDNSNVFFNRKTVRKNNYKKNIEKIVTPDEKIGYCIRTGKKITFNIKMPFCQESYKSWSKYKDKNYPEKFCHFTGEPSDGKTSFKNPIMRKNWGKAKEKFGNI